MLQKFQPLRKLLMDNLYIGIDLHIEKYDFKRQLFLHVHLAVSEKIDKLLIVPPTLCICRFYLVYYCSYFQ